MKTTLMLIAAVLVQAVGNALLSVGMKRAGAVAADPTRWLDVGEAAIVDPYMWLGVAFLLAFTMLFSIVLSWADLSLALPVVAMEVVVNVACAAVVLGESVSALHWLGTLLVACGVALVASSAGHPLAPASAPTEGGAAKHDETEAGR